MSKQQPMYGLPPAFRFACILLIFACQAITLAEGPKTTIENTLDGTWRAEVSDSQTITLTIKDSSIEMSAAAGEKQLPKWGGKLQISKDDPDQHMDWVELRSGNSKLPDNKCLFRLRGDILLVIGGGPNQRPTKFFSGAGGDPKTLVFLRITPKIEKLEPELPKKAS